MDKKNVVLSHELQNIMSDRFGRYSKYIIQERALPDVRDGLKPVQRRILYAMYEDGNTFDKAYRKSAKTVGLVIGNYHPHGDSSVYEAMVRLSQTWKMNVPLVDMQGNNGSIDDDPAAAMRYTEARLSGYSQQLLNDIDQNTVIFTPNFDDTSLEPSVLPAGIPQLLVNGASGIAAGYATNIPPHNLVEIIEGTIYRINHPNCTLPEINTLIKGPDFPTGGIVQGKSGILDAFSSGKGRVVIRSKAQIVQQKTIQQIVITEIPYEVVKSNLVKKIDEFRINKTLDALLDVRDESDRNGLRIVCDLKKESDAELILNYLYKNTDAQIYYNYNMVAIINQRPILAGLLDVLDAFIEFRKDLVLKRSKHQLEATEKRMHILQGLIKAISVLDEVISLIRSATNKAEAKLKLIERFNFSDEQAEAIVNLRLYRLTNTDILELKDELAQLLSQQAELRGIIDNTSLLKALLVKELNVLKKSFSIGRRSVIEDEVDEIVIDTKAMIPNEKTYLTLSEEGYLKRVSIRSFQASENTATTLKEGDRFCGVIEAETFDSILIFLHTGKYVCIPLLSIEEGKWKDLGNHIGHYVKLEGNHKVIASFLIKSFDSEVDIILATEKGLIKRSPLKAFEVNRTNKSYEAISLMAQDRVVACFEAYDASDILVSSAEGYAALYKKEDIPLVQVKSKGVKALNLSKGDRLASACALYDDKAAICVVSMNGQMKRLKRSDFELSNRPAKGELLARKVKTNPIFVDKLIPVFAYDRLQVTQEPQNSLLVKDIPFMDKASSYSNGMKDIVNAYLVLGIKEIKIVDLLKKNPVEFEKTPPSDEASESILKVGSANLPKEVLDDDQKELEEIEFIHFDL